MSALHAQLASGRWQRLSFIEQMAHTGSAVERFLKWRAQRNAVYAERAFGRAMELLNLTIKDYRNRTRLRELTRVREALVDFFAGDCMYKTSETYWKKYFACFTYAARKDY